MSLRNAISSDGGEGAGTPRLRVLNAAAGSGVTVPRHQSLSKHEHPVVPRTRRQGRGLDAGGGASLGSSCRSARSRSACRPSAHSAKIANSRGGSIACGRGRRTLTCYSFRIPLREDRSGSCVELRCRSNTVRSVSQPGGCTRMAGAIAPAIARWSPRILTLRPRSPRRMTVTTCKRAPATSSNCSAPRATGPPSSST